MITECIKEGFRLANRNAQLVFIRVAVTIINAAGFLIFLGLPVLAAVLYMGFDMSHAKDLLPSIMENPFGLVSKYLWLVFIAGMSVIFYLLASSVLFLYALGGILGVLRNSAVHMQNGPGLSSFFREANKNFSGLLRLVFVLALFSILIFILFIILFGTAAAVMYAFTGHETRIGVFFGSFVLLSVMVFSGMIFIAGFILAVYAMVIQIVEKSGAIDTVRKTVAFLNKRPSAFLFYMVLLSGVMLVNIIFFLLEVSFGAVPVIAPFLAFFIMLLNAFLHSYITVAVWSSLIVYYVKCTGHTVYQAMYEI